MDDSGLTRDQLLDIYYHLHLTRFLEERIGIGDVQELHTPQGE